MSESPDNYDDERLRGCRFETRPKIVQLAPNFRDQTRRLEHEQALEDDLNDVIDYLTKGHILPSRFYRSGIDTEPDDLLEAEGIKHLHLGGQDSDVLVFLVEYETRIVILEVNSHLHFRTKPVGSILLGLHKSCLRAEDERAATNRFERVKAKTLAAIGGLLPRRDRD